MMKVSGLRRSASATRSLASMTDAVDHAQRAIGALLLVLALLVLDQDRPDADLFVAFDHARDTLDVAVTVVAVGEEGQVGRRRDVANALGHVGQADEPDVRQPIARRRAAPSRRW